MTRLVPQFLISALLTTALIPAAEEPTPLQGQWVHLAHKDKDPANATSFSLTGESDDPQRRPTIVLTCDGGQPPTIVYLTGVKLASQAHNVYDRYADSIWAYIKIDNGKIYRALWEIVPGGDRSSNQASLDARTVRSLFQGERLRVRFRDAEDEDHIDQFTLTGLSLHDLQPYCAPRWLKKLDLARTIPH